MRLSDYEKQARKEVEAWRYDEASLLQQIFDWTMRPFDWVVKQVVPDSLVDQAGEAIARFVSTLSEASSWTYDEGSILKQARERQIAAESLSDLRDKPLEDLDQLARSQISENTILAAIEGGGTGLGGAALIVADIPLLFTINLRLIQQIGACYGFSIRDPQYRPLVLSIFDVAASGSQKAKNEATREMSVAAAAFAHDLEYRGRSSSDTFQEQNRHLPREIAKNLIGRKLGQLIPVAGAAIGAGINYWFTLQTAEAAFMLFRSLHVERKERI